MNKKFLLMMIIAVLTTAFAQPCFPPFEAGRNHVRGTQISYNGQNFVANWDTQVAPSGQHWGAWENSGSCYEEIVIDQTTPQDRQVAQSLSQFLLFATNDLQLNSGVNISGTIGANGNISFGDVGAGWRTIFTGDIYSRGAVSTYGEVIINGNIFANSLQLGWQALC